MSKRLFIIVLDSFGIGELPDAAFFGDEGSNTLASVFDSPLFSVPNLQKLGLFNIQGVNIGSPSEAPAAAFARLREQSAGKDTTIGHWEMAGIISKEPFPVYPEGFPTDIISELSRETGRRCICNKPYSGTAVIHDYGREHIETGALIVYTSADSVVQIAAHEKIIPVAELYKICETARRIMQGDNAVGRIIARPFDGDYPDFYRTSNRHDFSLPPTSATMLNYISGAGRDVIAVGKISDIFTGSGITRSIKSKNNIIGMEETIKLVGEDFSGLCYVNLVDFDMLYGHRNDIDGYAQALTDFDVQLGELIGVLREDDAVIITSDHGCDPATPSTDHSREYAPMLMFGGRVRPGIDLGTRDSFADIAATAQEYLGLENKTDGVSFLHQVLL